MRIHPGVLLTSLLLAGAVRAAEPTLPVVLFAEDFEGVVLGNSVEEEVSATGVWSDTPPTGWTVDDSFMPGNEGDPLTDGVVEWYGWAFADKDWWAQTSRGQQREHFSFGSGTVAIADPDEWDDLPHPVSPAPNYYDARMETGPIDISGVAVNSIFMVFDSSWRAEDMDDDWGLGSTNSQTAIISVSYDGGPDIEIMHWSSTPGPLFHDDMPNESVTLHLNNPEANSMVVKFRLAFAGNDWWWAIDNLLLTSNPSTAETVTEATLLSAADGEASDRYGDAVDLDRGSQKLIIGAPMEDTQGADAGAAYILSVETGLELHKLTVSDASAGDGLGQAVAIQGSFAAAAAPFAEDNGANSGSAYIFNSNTGAQLFELTPDDGESGDLFGWSISIAGDKIAIGAPGDDDQGVDAGAVYLFSLTTGMQLRKLLPPSASDGDWFGFSVGMADGKVAVGTPNDDDGGLNAGATYIMNADSGTQLGKLAADDTQRNDWFGYAVGMSGGKIAVGAPHQDNQGAVYLYNATNLAQAAKVTGALLAADDDQFGFSLAVSRDHLLVGTAANSNSEGTLAGAAFLFDLSDFSMESRLLHDEQETGEFMAMAAAISGDAVVLGAPLRTVGLENQAGSAYLSFLPKAVTNSVFADWVAAYGLLGTDATASADPNGDDMVNFVSYSFDKDPAGEGGEFPIQYRVTPEILVNGTSFAITFDLPAAARPDVRYMVHQSADLVGGDWTEIKRKEGTAAWSGIAPESSTTHLDGSTQVVISSTLPLNRTDSAFLRFQVEPIP